MLKDRIAMSNIILNAYSILFFFKVSNLSFSSNTYLLVWSLKVKAVKLFFTPEDLDDPVNRAKKYFLQTGTLKVSLPHI